MQCNIDSKGKAVRLVSGLIVTAIGMVLLGLGIAGPLGEWWGWALAIGTLIGGLFQVYEGWAGWCVVRALGFRTPV